MIQVESLHMLYRLNMRRNALRLTPYLVHLTALAARKNPHPQASKHLPTPPVGNRFINENGTRRCRHFGCQCIAYVLLLRWQAWCGGFD